MPNFKPKKNKKIKFTQKYSQTLDFKHQEIMKEFKYAEEVLIPSLKEKRKEIANKYKTEKNAKKKNELKERLRGLRKEIKGLKNRKIEYLLNNSKYIFNYFEKKKEISEGKCKKTIINSFFKKNSCDKEKKACSSYLEKYMTNINESYINMDNFVQDYDICSNCSSELTSVEYEGVLICKNCFNQIPFFIENIKPSYKEPPKEVCFYAYKRINHFREILAQFQAKETTQIPDKVIEDIKNQIKKERIGINQVTNAKAKDILKKLGYNKFYEHIPFIKDKLGIKPPVMNPRLEEKLCNLFLEIQRPYAKHCPEGRVNFLNYYYVLFKLCELLDETSFLEFFPMLKDPVKRIEQDEIWKKICNELNWEYKSTI